VPSSSNPGSLHQFKSPAQHAGLQAAKAAKHIKSSQEPVRSLSDVSHRLKKLEKAVSAHMLQAPRSDTSILSAFSSGNQPGFANQQQQSVLLASGGLVSPSIPRSTDRSHFKETLSEIKAEGTQLPPVCTQKTLPKLAAESHSCCQHVLIDLHGQHVPHNTFHTTGQDDSAVPEVMPVAPLMSTLLQWLTWLHGRLKPISCSRGLHTWKLS